MRSLVASLKLLCFALWSLIIVPIQLILMSVHKGNGTYILPRIWHRGVCVIFRVSFETEGVPATDQQTLYIFNHLSYLDIPLIGGVLRKASFLAKKEVSQWPVFGFLANLQNTAYIERKQTAIQKERDKLKERVDKRQNLIIFAEGTSTDGVEVRNFKSSLFSLAQNSPNPDLQLQPVTINLVYVNSIVPQNEDQRRIYTWPVEDPIELPDHLWRFAKSRGAHLRMVFHPPILARDFDDRKTLAKACHNSVSNGLENLKIAA